MKTPTLTLKKRISLPPQAVTRVNLQTAAHTVRSMQATTPATVIIRDYAERDALKLRVAELEAELAKTGDVAAARAHREERLKAITLRVVDNRAAWAAKMGLKQRAPLVAITSTRVITADVWQQPETEDGEPAAPCGIATHRRALPHTAMIAPRMPLSSLLLTAQCCALKGTVVEQQAKITALQENARRDADKIAALISRNQQLTRSLHREACRG